MPSDPITNSGAFSFRLKKSPFANFFSLVSMCGFYASMYRSAIQGGSWCRYIFCCFWCLTSFAVFKSWVNSGLGWKGRAVSSG